MKKHITIITMETKFINQLTFYLKEIFQHWNYDERINTSRI
jgi:hypothetical protein